MRFNLVRVLNPAHHVLRRIHQLSSNVVAVANSGQWRTDQTSRSRDTRDGVACIAAIFTNLNSPPSRVAAAGQLRTFQNCLVIQVVTANRPTNNKRNKTNDPGSHSAVP